MTEPALYIPSRLTTPPNKNRKLHSHTDSEGNEWSVLSLSLFPNRIVCPNSKFCFKGCIVGAGMARYKSVNRGRKKRTRLFFKNKPLFIAILRAEILRELAICEALGIKLAVRLNAFSDIDWTQLIKEFESLEIQFYDYTKVFERLPSQNYHITYSYDGSNKNQCIEKLEQGYNVAVVFDPKTEQPKTLWGFDVINGDDHDLRFLDQGTEGRIIALTYKRPAGVVQTEDQKQIIIKQSELYA